MLEYLIKSWRFGPSVRDVHFFFPQLYFQEDKTKHNVTWFGVIGATASENRRCWWLGELGTWIEILEGFSTTQTVNFLDREM